MDDPYLKPFEHVIRRRTGYLRRHHDLYLDGPDVLPGCSLTGYHRYFGLHNDGNGWVFREWAPNAISVHIVGEMTGWQVRDDFSLRKTGIHGVWEGSFPLDRFHHKDLFRLVIAWDTGQGDRIPSAATRVVQDPHTLIFNAQVWYPDVSYVWKHPAPDLSGQPMLIYEAHVGMAQEQGRIGSYREFAHSVLPQIRSAGYTTLQLMAIQEHPFYGSFGYHVSSFFAPSSRFGTPDDLKYLVDTAHGMGMRVLMDIVHSHAVRNEVEGLSRFDGSEDQFFHPGTRGLHPLWDSRCFNYGKPAVISFLLSNCRYWVEEFHMDGFRFDGVTSMVFLDHGINRAFVSYADYFGDTVDLNALVYLSLANRVIHAINPSAVTIAEDVSGYPGIAASEVQGGIGFDFRFAMGVPDFWIKLVKDHTDESWPLGRLWHELNARRDDERCISYAESHDQALVGDQTLMMRLMGGDIYSSMAVADNTIRAFRGVALHKMIRLITLASAGSGYLNFMGNEFGHPEWIDFPSQRNNWSYHYARRQWSLKDDPSLFFSRLAAFDRDMIRMSRSNPILDTPKGTLLHLHEQNRIMAFERSGLVFVFNFHTTRSFSDYEIPACPGRYTMLLDTDATVFGGQGRLARDQVHLTLYRKPPGSPEHFLSLYLTTRTGLVLKKDPNPE
ncbi:MAG: alpha amylase C-terminal domain-containing protein [Pseudomonadota bacterium]